MRVGRAPPRPPRISRDDIDPNVSVDPNVFPGYTEYEKTLCCCTKIGEGSDQLCFCGNWLVSPGMPIFVSLISFGDIAIHCWITLFETKIFGYIWVPITFLALLMFIICYYKAIYLGPGYFPFYYNWAKQNLLPPTNDQTVIGTQESFAGVTSNDVQYNWSKMHPQPPRCTMSRLARRFVIRPDHFCGYIGVWVGKRNHKLFILFNLYATLFTTLSTVGHIVPFFYLSLEDDFPKIIANFIFLAFCLVFVIMCSQFFIMHYSMAKKNITSWEKWNGFQDIIQDNNPDHFQENLKEVFGENLDCCHKFCPYSAFPDKTNEELVANYLPYSVIRENHSANQNSPEAIPQQIPQQVYNEESTQRNNHDNRFDSETSETTYSEV